MLLLISVKIKHKEGRNKGRDEEDWDRKEKKWEREINWNDRSWERVEHTG